MKSLPCVIYGIVIPRYRPRENTKEVRGTDLGVFNKNNYLNHKIFCILV